MEGNPAEKLFETAYSGADSVFGKPDDFILKIPSYLDAGEVLDLGAGQGRNALWLGSHGFNVEARDISETGVNTINKEALEKGISVTATKVDAREEIEKTYDVVTSILLMHYLTRDEALSVIEEMKSHTRPEGLNVVMAFTKEGDFFKLKSQKEKFYLDLGELREIYKDWAVLEYAEEQSYAAMKTKDGNPMTNILAKIIAKKPLE